MGRRWWVSTAGLVAALIVVLSPETPAAMGDETRAPMPTYIIDTWETVDGLPENSATAMAQTDAGYLIVGTFGGLAQFDGVGFSEYGDPQTAAGRGPGVVNLHLDSAGRLWMSTYEGLFILSGGQTRELVEADGWTGDMVKSFAERGNGDILLTTYNEKILEFRDDQLHELPAPGSPGSMYFAGVDTDGLWWCAQNTFIGRWNGSAWESMVDITEPSAIACGAGRGGGLWILIGAELRKYVGGREVARRVLSERPGGVWHIYEDSESHVWVSTYDRGVCRVAPSGEVARWTTNDGLLRDSIRFVFEDREHNIWVGASGGGLSRFKPRRFHTVGPAEGLPRFTVTSSCPDTDGSILIATYGRGLFRWDGSKVGAVEVPGWPHGSEPYIQSVLRDRAGRLWVGYFGARAAIMDGNEVRWLNATDTGGNNVIALFEDSRGRMWISGGQTIALYEGDRFESLEPGDGQSFFGAFCFAESSAGDIWATTGEAVYRRINDRFEAVVDEHGDPITGVEGMAADRDGSMWLACHDGLVRWRAGRIDRIAEPEALKTISGLIDDGRGYYWLTTPRGVLRVAHDHLRAAADGTTSLSDFQLFDRGDGLETLSFASRRQPTIARDPRGRLWFTVQTGVAMSDPTSIRLNDILPPVDIVELSYRRPSASPGGSNDQSLQRVSVNGGSTSPLTLPPGSRGVEIRYAALSFTSPEKVAYEVMLEGSDAGWRPVGGRREAYYDSLPPGQHTFRVRAANNDGLWDRNGAEVSFVIEHFYWQTTWFRVGSILAAIAVAGAGAWLVSNGRRRGRRRSEERFRLVVEAAPSAMIVTNRDGVIELVNAQAEQVFGYSRDELVGRPLEVLLPERFRKVHPELREEYTRHPTSRRMGMNRELFGLRKGGAEISIEVGLNSIDGPSGALVLATIVDTTERRRAGIEAARQRNELAHLSRVTMLGELSASLAHELNQPLTAILSNTQAAQHFLASGPEGLAEVREILSEIVSDSNRASEVIRRLRSLFKKGRVEPEPLDLIALVQEVVTLVHSDAVIRHVEVGVEPGPERCMAIGDRVQLQQVILNLLLNAFDALEHVAVDRRRVRVRVARLDEEFISVTVNDTGPGLTEEQQSKVFEPFYTTKREGLGMGLSISRSIIVAHGGRIDAGVNIEGGTTFSFTVPAASDKARGTEGASG